MTPRAEFCIDGVRYRWCGYYGCQLESMEWFTVPAGTQRTLQLQTGEAPVTVTVFTTQREGLKVRTSWAVSARGTIEDHARRIENLREQLRRLV